MTGWVRPRGSQVTQSPDYFTCVCFCQTLSHLWIPCVRTPQFGLFLHPGDEGWLGTSETWERRTKPYTGGRLPPRSPESPEHGHPTYVQATEFGRWGREGGPRRAGTALTERAKEAVGLPHHVPVQGPLRGPQTPPLLPGEVHGDVREAHGLRFPPLAPGQVWFPRGERSHR